jgi:hypothetical protein
MVSLHISLLQKADYPLACLQFRDEYESYIKHYPCVSQ